MRCNYILKKNNIIFNDMQKEINKALFLLNQINKDNYFIISMNIIKILFLLQSQINTINGGKGGNGGNAGYNTN